jgi:hypothetical protein
MVYRFCMRVAIAASFRTAHWVLYLSIPSFSPAFFGYFVAGFTASA